MSLFGSDFGWRLIAFGAGALALVITLALLFFVRAFARPEDRPSVARGVTVWGLTAVLTNVVSFLLSSGHWPAVAQWIDHSMILYPVATYAFAAVFAWGFLSGWDRRAKN